MYVFEKYKVNALQYMQQIYHINMCVHVNKWVSVCSSKHSGHECCACGSDNMFALMLSFLGDCLTHLTIVIMCMYFKASRWQ